jgi:hypothetical protein
MTTNPKIDRSGTETPKKTAKVAVQPLGEKASSITASHR